MDLRLAEAHRTTKEPPTMKIVRFTAENFKKLTAVEITPDGALVQITGKNGQGKSSVLDGIASAIEWAAHAMKMPIRKGADGATLKIDFGDMVVTRTFSRVEPESNGDLLTPAQKKGYTTSVKVESKDGARYPSPQAVLDKLIGSLSFDPLAFADAEPEDQFEMLRALVPGFDFKATEDANAEDYKARTDANRKAKECLAQAAGIAIPDDAATERADELALIREMEDAGKVAVEIEQHKAKRAKLESAMTGSIAEANYSRGEAGKMEDQIADLRERLNNKLERAQRFDIQAANLLKEIGDFPPDPSPPDTTEIRAKITRARLANKWCDERDRKAALTKSAAQYQELADALTSDMEKRNAEMRAAIDAANLAIPNLTFSGNAILMNGVPFEQASTAERLRASAAVAMASNPKLRVLRIMNGNDLDEDGMRVLAEMAVANDYQIWIERLSAGDAPAVVLEDGHVKGAV